MTPLFSDDAKWLEFEAIAKSWLHTPFRHMQRTKGRGVDCAQYTMACMQEAGVVSKLEYDFYPPRWFFNTNDEILLNTCGGIFDKYTNQGYKAVELPPNTPLMRGDMVCFIINRNGVVSHSGIMLENGRFLHVSVSEGVSERQIDERWQKRLGRIFRIYREA